MPNKLLTLQETSERLNVSIDKLLLWNEYNILKPTITQTGEIGYTEDQIKHFLTLSQAFQDDNKENLSPFLESRATSNENGNKEMINRPFDIYTTKSIKEFNSSGQDQMERIEKKNNSTVSFTKYIIPAFVMFICVSVFVFAKSQGGDFWTQQKEVFENKASSLKFSGYNSSLTSALLSKSGPDESLVLKGEEFVKGDKAILSSVSLDQDNIDIQAKRDKYNNILSPQSMTNEGVIGSDNERIYNNSAFTTFASRATCIFCNEEEVGELAIDSEGNIKEEENLKYFVSAFGGSDNILAVTSQTASNNNTGNQMVLLITGVLIFIFILQKQFAYLFRMPYSGSLHSSQKTNDSYVQKILEVDQKTDGTVVLYYQGSEYRVSKPELYSDSDQFIERLMELNQPGIKEIEYDISTDEKINLSTPLSRLVTRLGFVGIKRELFFPRTSKDRVLFRRYVTKQDLEAMNLTKNQIADELTS